MNDRLVGQTRAASVRTDEPVLLVLLHGLGSDESDLLALAPELDPRLDLLTLRAPHRYEYGGYAWFGVEWNGEGLTYDAAGAQASVARLRDELHTLMAERGAGTRLVLGGFSQGAMMTLGVLLAEPSLLSGALLMSGMALPELLPVSAPEGLASVPVLAQHGTEDPVLPVALGRAARDILLGMGADVTYHEYPMAHAVSRESLAEASRWLQEILK